MSAPPRALEPAPTLGAEGGVRQRPAGSRHWRPIGLIALLLVIPALVLTFGPLLAPYDVDEQNLRARLLPPAWVEGGDSGHLLGTDALGRDIWSRIVIGMRVSLIVAGGSVVLALLVGSTAGLLAGYLGGWVDAALMRLVDVQLAFPSLILAIAIAALLRPSIPILVFVLFLRSWVIYARLVRSSVLTLRSREFVQAAVLSGATVPRVLLRHLAPNVASLIIVVSSFQLAELIILESSLSFLGLGVQAPTPSWGSMLSDGRPYMTSAWWLATFPGLAIMAAVLGANTLGDILRDWLDPRSRRV